MFRVYSQTASRLDYTTGSSPSPVTRRFTPPLPPANGGSVGGEASDLSPSGGRTARAAGRPSAAMGCDGPGPGRTRSAGASAASTAEPVEVWRP